MIINIAKTILLLNATTLLALGCSGSSDEPKTFCQELQDKTDSCQIAGAVNCSATSNAPQAVQDGIRACLIPKDCTAWSAYLSTSWMDSATLACFTQHGVQFTGLFNCADGNGGVPVQFKCDGKTNCPDGSDETGC